MEHSFQEFTASDLKKIAQSFADGQNSKLKKSTIQTNKHLYKEMIKYKYLNHTLVIEQDEYGNGGTYTKLRVCLQRTIKTRDYETKKITTAVDEIFADEYL